MGTVDALGTIFTKIYLPWYWSEAMINLQDGNALLAGFYLECKMDKLMYTMTHLLSVEGLAELFARALGSIPSYLMLYEVVIDPSSSDMELGFAIGKVSGNILDYKI